MKFFLIILSLFVNVINDSYAQRVFKESKVNDSQILYELGEPRGIIIMQNDTLLVSRDLHRIEVYDNNYQLLSEYSSKGKGPGEFLAIIGILIYKNQLIILDNANSKVVFMTFEKDPKLIKEIPVLDNAKRLFMVNDTLIVQHALKDFILAEYDSNGKIISSYPKLVQEDKYSNLFDLQGDLYFYNNKIYLFKMSSSEGIVFERNKNKYYTINNFITNQDGITEKQKPDEFITKDLRIITAPKTDYMYRYELINGLLIVQNIEKKKGVRRILDFYDLNSFKYLYSIQFAPDITKGIIEIYTLKGMQKYIFRSVLDRTLKEITIDLN